MCVLVAPNLCWRTTEEDKINVYYCIVIKLMCIIVLFNTLYFLGKKIINLCKL